MDTALEQQYLSQCRAGRPHSFRPLVDAYFGRAVRLAGALVGAADAEDVAQEAFVAAYDAIGSHEAGRPFYPWLRGILVNRAKVFVRTRNRARSRADRAAEMPEHWTRPKAPERRHADLVGRALAALDEDDRALVVLKHVEGYTYDELAAELGIPSGTVMSRLYRARERLRQAVLELEPDFESEAEGDAP